MVAVQFLVEVVVGAVAQEQLDQLVPQARQLLQQVEMELHHLLLEHLQLMQVVVAQEHMLM